MPTGAFLHGRACCFVSNERQPRKAGKPFALFNFEAVSKLSSEEAELARAYGQQFMEIVNAAALVPELAEAS